MEPILPVNPRGLVGRVDSSETGTDQMVLLVAALPGEVSSTNPRSIEGTVNGQRVLLVANLLGDSSSSGGGLDAAAVNALIQQALTDGGYVKADGSVKMTGNLDMNGQFVINSATGTPA